MDKHFDNNPNLYFFRGSYLSARELMQYSQGIPLPVLRERLRSGWDAERAIRPYVSPDIIDPKWEGKDLLVEFLEPLGNVYPEMQPQLQKPYVAVHSKQPYKRREVAKTKRFFVIQLENGKSLIVYPSEFHILGEVSPVPAKKEPS